MKLNISGNIFGSNTEYFANAPAKLRHVDGSVKALRELGTPAWVIKLVIASYRLAGKYRATIALAEDNLAMCDSVFFENQEYRSLRQLAELVGGEDKLVW